MSRRRDESGAAALELALVLPILMVIVTGVVDFGYALMIKAQVEEAAEEAAVYAARYPQQFAEARSRATDAVTATALTTTQVVITCAGSGIGRELTVVVTPDYDPPFGFIVDDLDIQVQVYSDVLSDETSTECP